MPLKYDLTVPQAQALIPEIKVIDRLKPSGQKVAFIAERGHERFALKVYDPTHIDARVYREADAMFRIQSPYVIELKEFHYKATPQGVVVYMLEELIDGGDIADMIRNGLVFSPQETVVLIDQLLQGLEATWSERIVHRDIKPANLMIRKTGELVIIDYGIARHLELDTITHAVPYLGPRTVPYAPPEMLEDDRKDEIDIKSDLFSVGITAYEMLTGQHPIWKWNMDDQVNLSNMKAVNATPLYQKNPQISKSLSDYVMKLMNRERFNRPADATDARERLKKVSL